MAEYDDEEKEVELDDQDDYESVNDVINLLQDSQSVDKDIRDFARECEHFVNKRDGQWQPEIIQKFNAMPRFTFDKTSQVVDSIAGEIEQANFAGKVIPSGEKSSKEVAEIYEGLLRHVENLSDAPTIYSSCARQMLVTGQDGFRVKTDYVDSDSFDQDIIFEKINNFNDRVWFDTGSEKQDRSDAEWAIVLHKLTHDEFEDQYPDADPVSVGDDVNRQVYSHKPEFVTIGELLYKKRKDRTLILMSNGQVFEESSEDYGKVKDELEAAGVTEVKRRNRPEVIVCIRFFNASEWISDAKETPFKLIPIVPMYGDFLISENKARWKGKVQSMIDPQRVYNYVRSRQIAEGALAPRQKYWMTRKEAEGEVDSLKTMNTNQDPVQFYTPDPEHPQGPELKGGVAVNQGLELSAQSAANDLQQAANLFDASMGASPNAQSGVAITNLQNKGDTGSVKYFKAMEKAITYAFKIAIGAIPKVYDTQREQRILNEDGSSEIVTLNQQVFDQQTGQMITLNDLSAGIYDVVCSSGAAFQNRQQEAVQALLELGQTDPTIIQIGKDILLGNIDAPGMNKLAERVRAQLVQSGQIPFKQLTGEEKQAAQQAAQQPKQPDAETIAAQSMMVTAQAKQVEAQAKVGSAQAEQMQAQAKLQLQAQQQQHDQEKDKFQMFIEQQQANFDLMKKMYEAQQTQANTLKIIFEAMGANAIVSQGGVQAYAHQADQINETQRIVDDNLQRM